MTCQVTFSIFTPMLRGGTSIGFLQLMFESEATILNPLATNAELGAVERDLAHVRHAR